MYAVFDPANGAVEQFVNLSEDQGYGEVLDRNGMSFIVTERLHGQSPNDYHVENGILKPRPRLAALVSKTTIKAGGDEFTTITGLPRPCVVMINGQAHEVDGGRVELDAEFPRTYRVAVDHFPYRYWQVEIVAI